MDLILVFMIVCGVLVGGASLTGNAGALCERIGGTYSPQEADVCPGGDWRKLFQPPK